MPGEQNTGGLPDSSACALEGLLCADGVIEQVGWIVGYKPKSGVNFCQLRPPEFSENDAMPLGLGDAETGTTRFEREGRTDFKLDCRAYRHET